MVSTLNFLTLATIFCLAAGAPADPNQRSFGFGGFNNGGYNPMFNGQGFSMMNSPYNQPMNFGNPGALGMNAYPGAMNPGVGFPPALSGYQNGFMGANSGYPMGNPMGNLMGNPMGNPMGNLMAGPPVGMPGAFMQPSMQFQQLPFRSADEKVEKH